MSCLVHNHNVWHGILDDMLTARAGLRSFAFPFSATPRQTLRHTRVRPQSGALHLLEHFMLCSGQASLVKQTTHQKMSVLLYLTTHMTCLTAVILNMRQLMHCDRVNCTWTQTHLINVTLRLLHMKITLAREFRMRLTGLVLLHKVTWAAATRVVLGVLLNATFPVACMLALLATCNSSHSP